MDWKKCRSGRSAEGPPGHLPDAEPNRGSDVFGGDAAVLWIHRVPVDVLESVTLKSTAAHAARSNSARLAAS